MRYFFMSLALVACAAHGQGSNYFVPGCALTGTATSQVVNLAASGCITGNLPVSNLFGGTGASSSTYLSGTGWTTPPGVPGGTVNQIQYNSGSGTFTGVSGLSWNNSSSNLLVGSYSSASNGQITIGGTSTGTGTLQSGGGQLTVTGKTLILSSSGGGALNIAGSAGSATAAGTTISVTAGNTGTSSTSAGGAVNITAGTGNATASGGTVNIVGGSGYSTTGNAGNVLIQGGLGSTSTQSGAVSIVTNNTTRLTVANDGGITTAGQTDEGAGTVNAAGLYQGAIRVPHIAFAEIITPGGGTACSTNFSQGFGSCTSSGTGQATFTFSSGYFTFVPTCTLSQTTHQTTFDSSTSITTLSIQTYQSGAAASAVLEAICVGY